MDPELLLSAAIAALRASPPPGIDSAYVDGFFARNQAGLLEIVRRAFPTGRIEPAFQRVTEEHRLARIVLEATRRHLETGGLASAGRALADLLEGIDDHRLYEDRVLFPYLRAKLGDVVGAALAHAREEHEYLGDHLFALVADLRAGRRYQGPAIPALLHHFEEEEADIYEPARAAGLARTPAGNPGRLSLFAADIERLGVTVPAASAGEPTRLGGRRGEPIQPADLVQGQRVVTEAGQHGLVTEIHRITFATVVDGRRDDRDVHYSIRLRLDSGREAIPLGPLFAELAPPTHVVPDIQIGTKWLSPSEVWSQVYSRWRNIGTYAEKADNARKPDMKAQWRRHGDEARREFGDLYDRLRVWRGLHPDEPVQGLSPLWWRRLTLEAAETRTEDESWELAWLRKVPADWDTRWKPGDNVIIHVVGPYGRQPDRGWTVRAIEGHVASLARGDDLRHEPLWMLKADDAVPVVETFAEPRYLMELAREMLATGDGPGYPTRGAVARAVKTFLGERGVAVSTHVRQGSMVTGIDLNPAAGSWSAGEQGRLRELLPGLNVYNERQASFEPWQTKGDDYDPYADYHGKSAGLLIPAEHVGRFAAILAGAMKAEGQTLNRLGEQRLAASARAGVVLTTGTRGGTTDLQRASAAEGCQDMEFDLPGHGRIRVVCGAKGRRDTWYNLYVRDVRYGYNGGRWARGQRPPEEVLAAVRERGVGAFG